MERGEQKLAKERKGKGRTILDLGADSLAVGGVLNEDVLAAVSSASDLGAVHGDDGGGICGKVPRSALRSSSRPSFEHVPSLYTSHEPALPCCRYQVPRPEKLPEWRKRERGQYPRFRKGRAKKTHLF